jgi:hypothetical protein
MFGSILGRSGLYFSMNAITLKWTPALLITSFPHWLPPSNTEIYFSGSSLDVEAVELILRRCAVAAVTGCTVHLKGESNSGLASLSAQGAADYASLTGAGNNILINP